MVNEKFLAAIIMTAMTVSNMVQVAEGGTGDFFLGSILVEGERRYDSFGNDVTEYSYYRTGGDVNVIRREEIERRHYTDIADAIKRLPGVQVSGPGYRGGEYGYSNFNTHVSINGDERVVILVDGRRIDNDASSFGGASGINNAKSMVALHTITNIANVETIEVIKGPGASIYGADATGGVINIITRKGSAKSAVAMDIAGGSWGKRKYAMTASGADGQGGLRYFLSLNRDESGDTEYKDGVMNRTYRFLNTRYNENGASLRLDKDFDAQRSLRFSYNYNDSRTHYPITAPDYTTYQRLWDGGLYSDYLNKLSYRAPGYRNWFWLDAALGSYNETRSNALDLTYTFRRDGGMDSFVRVFKDYRRFSGEDFSGLFGKSPAELNDPAEWIKARSGVRGTVNEEESYGTQLQWGRQYGKHDILTAWMYRKSDYSALKRTNNTVTKLQRSTVSWYVQDKIHLSDKWIFTPAVRFEHYGTFNRTAAGGAVTSPAQNSSSSATTLMGQTQYAFNDNTSAYFSRAQIFRPLRNGDYDQDFEKLDNEKGNSWTVGMRHELSARSKVYLNYGMTDMSNAIGRYSVLNTVTNLWENRAINTTQKKKAFNLTAEHKLDDNWLTRLSYSYVFDKYTAKNHQTLSSAEEVVNVQALINRLRPINVYQMDVIYNKGRWNGCLSGQVYSGMDTKCFTAKRFFVVGLDVNYEVDSRLSAYVKIDNLTDTAYETRGSAVYGPGAYPQPGRSLLIGMRYKL